jgi:hypothetical protein
VRIILTASRTWDDPDFIESALLLYAAKARNGMTIVHGDCPQGGDRQADIIARKHGWTIERHPADWTKYHRRAGYIRNAEMVMLSGDVCLAFIKDRSKGATMCADLAEKNGIVVERFIK